MDEKIQIPKVKLVRQVAGDHSRLIYVQTVLPSKL